MGLARSDQGFHYETPKQDAVMVGQRISKPVQPVVKIVLPNRVRRTPVPAIGPELDKVLDEFVADKPKSIMKE